MKIFGHPLHMMLIHFPSALFPMECVCYGLLYYTGKSSFADASFYCMTGGVVMGWLAVIFGTFDLTKIPSEKPRVINKALIHGGINTSILIIYSVFTFVLFKKYPELPDAKTSLLITKICLMIFLVAGNYLGASLVLTDKVGTENQ